MSAGGTVAARGDFASDVNDDSLTKLIDALLRLA
jgi:hypothetical protein